MASPVKAPLRADKWGYERMGYDNRPTVAYAPCQPTLEPRINWIGWERRVAAALLIGGVLWGLEVIDPELRNLNVLWATPGPLETCGVSALVWLHAWWRSSVRPK